MTGVRVAGGRALVVTSAGLTAAVLADGQLWVLGYDSTTFLWRTSQILPKIVANG